MKKQSVIRVFQVMGGATAILFVAGVVVPSILMSRMPASYSLFGTPFHTISIAGITFAYKLQNILAAVLGGAFGPMIAFVVASPGAAKRASQATLLAGERSGSVSGMSHVAAMYSHFLGGIFGLFRRA